jgi:hypothetical protein
MRSLLALRVDSAWRRVQLAEVARALCHSTPRSRKPSHSSTLSMTSSTEPAKGCDTASLRGENSVSAGDGRLETLWAILSCHEYQPLAVDLRPTPESRPPCLATRAIIGLFNAPPLSRLAVEHAGRHSVTRWSNMRNNGHHDGREDVPTESS